MKDYLNRYAKWCDASIKLFNQYFDSRIEQYNLKGLGVDTSFKMLVSRGDVISDDFMYFSCYNYCVGKLELIGSLINMVGD